MKKLIATLSCLIVLTGCSSDSDNDIQDNPVETKLIKEVQLDLESDISKTIEYTYDGNVLTQSVETNNNNSDVNKMVYNHWDDINQISGVSFFKNNTANGYESYYYENGQILSSFSNEDGNNTTKAYVYDSLLIAIQEIVGDYVSSSMGIETHAALPDGTNSITETYYNSIGVETHSIDYVSDVKNNPYLNVLPKAYADIKLKFSTNNVLTKTMLNGDVYSYEYTYSGNKPIQVIEKLNGVPKTKTTYTYQ